jgi:hypothetical protein
LQIGPDVSIAVLVNVLVEMFLNSILETIGHSLFFTPITPCNVRSASLCSWMLKSSEIRRRDWTAIL